MNNSQNTKLTPKEKAIKYFMKEEVRLIETGTIPEYPLQLDETIEEALKEQAKQIFEDLESYEGGQFSFIIGEKDGKDVIQEYKNKWVKTK